MQSETFENFLSFEIATVDAAIVEWFGRDVVEDNIRRYLKADFARVTRTVSTSTEYASTELDGRVLRVNDLGFVYVEGALQADNRSLPHATIRHSSFALDHPDVICTVANRVRDDFRDLAPERMCWYVHGRVPEALAVEASEWIRPYKRYLAVPMRCLSDVEVENEFGVRLEEPRSLDFYEEYSAAYETFWETDPVLQQLVRRESSEAMQSYLDQGALQVIRIEDQFVGVVAAAREYEHGLGGFCIHERLVVREFRRRGIGSLVLALFAPTLPGSQKDALWGTIVPENQASMRSAFKMGRVDVGGLFWGGL